MPDETRHLSARSAPLVAVPAMVAVALAVLAVVVLSIALPVVVDARRSSVDARVAQQVRLLSAALGESAPQHWGAQLEQAQRAVPSLRAFVFDQDGVVLAAVGALPPREVRQKMLYDAHNTAVGGPLDTLRYDTAVLSAEPGQRLRATLAVSHDAAAEPLLGAAVAPQLLVSVSAFAALAVAVAALFARSASAETGQVARRVAAMGRASGPDNVELAPLPMRSLDNVTALSAAFNGLLRRYLEGERGYRDNLRNAQDAGRDRAAFLAAVSHEFYTPLHTVLGFADVLLAEVDGPLSEEARDEVELVRQSAQQLRELIDDIIEFSAIEGGQLRVDTGPVPLREALRKVQQRLTPLLREHAAELQILGEVEGCFELDGERFVKALSQLLANGLHTQPGARTLRVVVRQSERDTWLELAGGGPALTDAEKQLVFSTFAPEPEQSGKASGLHGSGLSVALARRSLELQGARVTLLNSPGQGATFLVELPFALQRAEVAGDAGGGDA